MKVKQEMVPNINMMDIADVIKKNMGAYFQTCDVSVNNVPDLTKPPFHLACQGICGYPKLLDVGGQHYLTPTPHLDKTYDLRVISTLIDMSEAFYIGAGAGPFQEMGTNGELITNLKFGKNNVIEKNLSYTAKNLKDVEKNDPQFIVEPLKSSQFGILGNFLASKGMPGKAIRIAVSKSKMGKETDFLEAIRGCLKDDFKDKFIGLGGAFVLKTGTARIHIMPDFCPDPLDTDEKVKSWLKYYHVPAPLTCLGVLVNIDYKDFGLRTKHAHCFQTTLDPFAVSPAEYDIKKSSDDPKPTSIFDYEHIKYGGHYHYDITPDECSYEGYFVPVQTVCRIDQSDSSTEEINIEQNKK
ncbi:ester hydrolase C11orf54 homolog isoform X2 [Gordionus sp. m RMFG-2023]|uniref:ester hydrolase C11orf54 homolog isoform X2 n=1 Tax=Gordionus sp. m RMFG-2023 TaxID=3053472 RepID=UPI0031FC0FD7